MLHIICALKPEARPLLDRFNLQQQAAHGTVKIHGNPDSDITLTLSGMGKSAAGLATDFTRDYCKADKSHAWLNVGAAGHASLPVGQAVMVKKISADDSGRTWFPSRVFATALPACDLITLDKPGREYRAELFDMECAGFFDAAVKFATLELIQAVKIVSDNAEQPLSGVNPGLLSRLVGENLAAIEDVARQLLALSREQRQIHSPDRDFDAIIGGRHFTVSQRHQLRTLLRKWRALHPGETGLTGRLDGRDSAGQVLKFLREELGRTPIRFG